jgi:hypothetical protein
MDKSLLIFIAVGIGFLYFIKTFMHDVAMDDTLQYGNKAAIERDKGYERFVRTDDTGESILDVTGVPENVQTEAWNHLSFRNELSELFPDFDTMRTFIRNRVKGEPLRTKLMKKIKDIEDAFLSGRMPSEDAKEALKHLP